MYLGERKKKALEKVMELLAELKETESNNPTTASEPNDDASDFNEPMAKKQKLDDFSDLFDPQPSYSNTPQTNELSDYMNIVVDKETDILKFWCENRIKFPKLFKIFLKVLSVPATSCASERCFSIAGRIVEKRRT